MELQIIVKLMDKKMAELADLQKELITRIDQRASAIGEHSKNLAKRMMELQQGKTFMLDGIKVECTTATNLKKYAEGLCYQERINMELADMSYWAVKSNIEVLQTQISALQSQYKVQNEK